MICGDSSFFIAISYGRDQWHQKARKLQKRLRGTMVVSDMIISETITIVGMRSGGKAARQIYNYFNDSCYIVYTNEELLESAMKIHTKYDGKLSLADAMSLVIMKSMDIVEIASFDSGFDKVKGIKRLS